MLVEKITLTFNPSWTQIGTNTKNRPGPNAYNDPKNILNMNPSTHHSLPGVLWKNL